MNVDATKAFFPNYFLLGILFLIFTAGCREENMLPEQWLTDKAYYPLALGKSWTYEVDSILFDPSTAGTSIDTTHALIRKVVTDTFTDEGGRLWYMVDRFFRADETQPWRIHRVEAHSNDGDDVIRQEENLRFIPLIFPAQPEQRWDGNVWLPHDLTTTVAGEEIDLYRNWQYEIIGRGEVKEVAGQTFHDVVVVQEALDTNLIEIRHAVSWYEHDIGLIYRRWELLDTQCESCCAGDFALCQQLPWKGKAEKGFIIEEKLIGYE